MSYQWQTIAKKESQAGNRKRGRTQSLEEEKFAPKGPTLRSAAKRLRWYIYDIS